MKLFADDTVLYTVAEDPKTSSEALNANLEQVKRWSHQWLVNFNPKKTNLMNISLKKNVSYNNYPIYFNGVPLTEVRNHRHLGIEFSSDLKWTTHINNIIQSVAKMSDVIRKFKYRIDRKSLETMYFTFIRPKLEYASVIWDSCTENDKLRLEKIQLTFARIVTGAKKGTSHELLYKETSWSTLSDRRIFAKMKFFHKIYNKNVPEYLINILPLQANSNVKYNLRRGASIKQFYTRTEQFRKSIIPDCIRMWNSLPHNLRKLNFKDFSKRIVPSRSPNILYYGVQRKLSIIHAQLRMECSDLKSHLFGLYVIDSPYCICSGTREDADHFLMHCHLYCSQRKELFNGISSICNLAISTDLLLYGSNELGTDINRMIFDLVENFIKESGRFALT